MKKILIIAGGSEKKLAAFLDAAKDVPGVSVTTASFSNLSYQSGSPFKLLVKGIDVATFDTIYIRVVGKRLEDATVLARYAKEHHVRIVDKLYEKSHLMPESLGKSIELYMLISRGFPVPKTYFASIHEIVKNGHTLLGFPFVIKSTKGQKAREVWAPETKEDLSALSKKLSLLEKEGVRYFAQEFVPASQRIRIFILGGKAVAAFTRPTKWRKRFTEKEPVKAAINPIPRRLAKLSERAAKTVGLDIAGIDVLVEDKTGKHTIIEVNAAPSWNLITKENNMNVEKEILLFLKKK